MQIRWLAILGCLLITACSDKTIDEVAKNKSQPVAPAAKPEADVSEPAAKLESNATETKSAAEQFEALSGKFDSARKEFMEAYRAASEADRPQLIDEKLPKPESYAEEFLRIAAEHPADDAAVDSLIWVAANVRSGDAADKAYDLLFAEHIGSESLKEICMSVAYSMPSQKIEDRLNRLINESPHDSVKAAATFSLATYLSSIEPAKKYIESNPEVAGLDAEQLEYIRALDVQPQAIETLYQALISDYPDVKPSEGSKETYKEMAERALFEINFLSVGKVAPDIEGEDLDGSEFKLSDYRGKVVVLDFWGDW